MIRHPRKPVNFICEHCGAPGIRKYSRMPKYCSLFCSWQAKVNKHRARDYSHEAHAAKMRARPGYRGQNSLRRKANALKQWAGLDEGERRKRTEAARRARMPRKVAE